MSEPQSPLRARISILVAACAVLILQIATTRILSAAISYHSGMVVIGIVMLGLAASATSVFVHRNRRENPLGMEAAVRAFMAAAIACTIAAFGFSLASTLAGGSPIGFGVLVVLSAVLFFAVTWCAGYGVAFLLSEYSADVSRVYWFDLMGAAAGCLLVIPLLDGRSPLVVVIIVGAFFGVSAVLLTEGPTARRRAGGVTAVVALLAILASVFPAMTQLYSAKGEDQRDIRYQEWNRITWVTVVDRVPQYERNLDLLRERRPDIDAEAFLARWNLGWGMSPTYEGDVPTTLFMALDADAGTQIIEDGANAFAELEYLEYDVTNVAYHLRTPEQIEDTFVIGGGGGRDVVTGLHFGADEVVVAEMNPGVIRSVNEAFGDFSGRLYSHDRVTIRLGDARSTLSRLDRKFSVIQMSMIDTWAASVAGSLVLSENSLYTLEAFVLYLEHLDDEGILTVSRWASPSMWGEVGRTVSLMGTALRELGVDDPASHLAIVQTQSDPAVATCILKRTPFTPEERAQVDAIAQRMEFVVPFNGTTAETLGVDLGAIARGEPEAMEGTPFDLSPPTDDRPFFFNTRWMFASWVDAIREGDMTLGSPSSVYTVGMLLLLLLIGRILTIRPLERHNRGLPEAEQIRIRQHLGPMLYFAGIGLGFMLVEVGILQRYLTFLGHPTYAMSVVLFSVLLSSGLGSAISARLEPSKVAPLLSGLLVLVVLTAFAVPPLLQSAHALELVARMALAAGLVVPLGLCMGMIFPLGVRLLGKSGLDPLVPWVWAVNGLAGVIGSVLGMLVAMLWGYTAVLLLGALAYGATAIASRRHWSLAASI